MRVLILGHNYAPEMTGIGPYTTELAEHFAGQGHEVSVLTTFPHYPRYQWQGRPSLFKRERIGAVHVRRMRVILPHKPGAIRRIVFDSSVGLSSMLTSVGVPRPSVVIAVVPTLQNGLAGCILAKRWRIPCVLLVQDLPLEAGLAVGMLKPGLLYRAGTRLERLVYRLSSRIVVIGDQFRENLLAKGVRSGVISVIPDWVDLDSIRPRTAEPDVRRHLAGSDVEFLVLHTGTMAQKQGLHNVVEAAHALANEPRIRTVLVGDGPARAELEAEIEKRQLGNIRVLGIQPVDDFRKMLAASDALLLNQRAGVVDSVVPSKLLSYMAAGRPIIAAVNSASVAAKLITEAGCGVIVPPEDPPRLAEAIRRLRSRRDLCEAFGSRGRLYVEKRYGRDAVLLSWDRLVAETISDNTAGRPASKS